MRSAFRSARPTPPAREWSVAAIAFALLALLMTWPTLRHPRTTIPQDVYDPALQAWQVAWGGHALLHDPAGLWNTNASFPERNTLAFSDSLLGYAPTGRLGSGPADAVLRYNLLFVFAFALAGFGMYVLARQLGAGQAAAAVAGAAFAYAPWRFAHAGHLNILSTGGIALALAMLARGHGFSLAHPYRGRARPAWIVAGWLVATWQLSLGFGLGIPFAYVLLGTVLFSAVHHLVRRQRPARGVVLADLLGGAVFTGVVLLLARPYLAVLEAHPDARRSVEWLDLFSPPLRGFFTAWTDSWLWGASARASAASLGWPAEMTVLPGFTIIALAAAGLFISAWTVRARVLLALGVVLGVWVAMGTAAPWHGRFGYLILYRLPGFDSSRTPGRLVLWVLLLLCLLAAGMLTRVGELGRWTAILLALPLLAVLLEGVNRTPHPEVPTSPVALRELPAPILVLPTSELADLDVLLWSTDGFPVVVNGSSGYNPPRQAELREQLASFPDAATVATLRGLGVRSVVVLRTDQSLYGRALSADTALLGLERDDRGDAVVITL